ncbi:MAG: hypothetical protein ABI432_10050 [Flavobacteriales bacterium]
MDEFVFFRYDGKPFLAIREKVYQVIADDLRTKCMTALRPFADEIAKSKGAVHFEFDRAFLGARVRMVGIEEELQQRIAVAIPSLSTL